MTTKESRPTDRPGLAERVRRLARYGAGWDGYGAEAANPEAVEQACAFLSVLGAVPECLEADLEQDGCVALAGDLQGIRTVLSFAGDGRVEVMRRTDGTWREIGVFPLRDGEGRTVVPGAIAEMVGHTG